MPLAVALSEVLGALSYALDLTEGEPPGHAVRTPRSACGSPRRSACPRRSAPRSTTRCCSRTPAARATRRGWPRCSPPTTRPSSARMKVVDWPGARPPALDRRASVAPGRGTLERRGGCADARAPARGTRELIETPLRARRARSRAARIPRARPPTRSARSTSTGTAAATRAGLRGEQIPLLARIACLAQTVEVFTTAAASPRRAAMARERRGRWFDPALVDACLDAGRSLRVAPARATSRRRRRRRARAGRPRARGRRRRARPRRRRVRRDHRREVAVHRRPLAPRRRAGARRRAACGSTPAELRDLRRAGLLHDIGKLGVSNRILDKPGPLDRRGVRGDARAPACTRTRSSSASPALRPLAAIAAAHHERLDGSGYPLGLRGDDLALPARDPRRRRRLRGAHRRPPVPRRAADARPRWRSSATRRDGTLPGGRSTRSRSRPTAGPRT